MRVNRTFLARVGISYLALVAIARCRGVHIRVPLTGPGAHLRAGVRTIISR